MMDLPANVFVELIKSILLKDKETADFILTGHDKPKGYTPKTMAEARDLEKKDLIYQAATKANHESDWIDINVNIPEEETDQREGEDDEVMDLINEPKEEPKEEPKKKKWFEYTKGELNNFLNDAIDKQDWTLAREIQAAIEKKEK